MERSRSPLPRRRRRRSPLSRYRSGADILDRSNQAQEERREKDLAQRRGKEFMWRPKNPRVHKVDYEHFRNRYHEDKQDYAIEVLVGPPDLHPQIQDEERRQRETDALDQHQIPILAAYQLMEALTETGGVVGDFGGNSKSKNRASELDMSNSTKDTNIHRIRIQSQPILGYLTQLLGEDQKSFRRPWPRTFLRPFRPLIYFQPQMKGILAGLEERWESLESHENRQTIQIKAETDNGVHSHSTSEDEDPRLDSDSETSGTRSSIDHARSENLIQLMDKVMDSTEALRDMRCYVDFVDREIMPLHNLLQGNQPQKVAFDDLWSLFRLGELVYSPTGGDNRQGRDQELWRVYYVCVFSPRLDNDYVVERPRIVYADEPRYEDESRADATTEFRVHCYHIGHDGASYGAVSAIFAIESFLGERDIQSLEVYPLRLAENRDELLETLQKQGEKIQYTLQQRHQAYNNWSLTTPVGFQVRSHRTVSRVSRYSVRVDKDSYREDDAQLDSNVASEFIESHVIVDLEEAFKAHPGWRPQFHYPNISKPGPTSTTEDEDLGIQVWSDKSRSRLVLEIPELVQREDGVESRQRRENIRDTDAFLRYRAAGSTRWDKMSLGRDPDKLREEDIVLLPKRSFVYTLRERKFVIVDVNHLRPVIQDKEVFKSLKIRKEYKEIVRGLVSSHFQRKDLERLFTDRSSDALSQDLIQGKGKGLVILLHGAPGVGKTATAEAVAMEMKKPLFTITCGDLGLKASEVESSLTNIFHLAQKWDCVLLLDEADVFLSQRSRFDMKRNSIVSVFLRVLEYYNGLLFLTTNRVGTIDEAFKSRIQMSLYYPPLNMQQTTEIFDLNVEKLHGAEKQRSLLTGKPELVIKRDEIIQFAKDHYTSHSDSNSRWNGRQIRNAFQIASGLAYYHFAVGVDEAQSDGIEPPSAPVLDRTLFDKVQLATQNFDSYMRETQGLDDSERAHRVGERADHYRDSRQPPPSSAYAPDSRQSNFNVSGSFGVPSTSPCSHIGYGGSFASPGQNYPAGNLASGGQTTPSNAAQYQPFAPAGPQDPDYLHRHQGNAPSHFNNLGPRGDVFASNQSVGPPQTPNQRQQMQAGGSFGYGHLSPVSAATAVSPGYGVPSTRFQAPSVMEEEDSYD